MTAKIVVIGMRDGRVLPALILSEQMREGHLAVNGNSGERLTVSRIADFVCDGLGVPDARIEYTDSKRG